MKNKQKYGFGAIILAIVISIGLMTTYLLNQDDSHYYHPLPQQEIKTKKKVSKKKTQTTPKLLVVNKKHPLPKNYNPYNGEKMSSNEGGRGLAPEVQVAKDKLIKAMQKENLPISNQVSGYRDYDYQKKLYDEYVAEAGKQAADTFSARPGYSEHQSGLAFDLIGKDGELPTNDKLYKWLENNAYKYGFIIRFPREKTSITGYMGEEWHLRYVGVKDATQMFNKKIKTLEEYTRVSGGDYNADVKKDVSALDEYKK
ncbi:M15 family metallopeptidase [Lactobacillus sp. YT155]|uniref:M15 family metallopeptidase n=1 Tax=Lactobacillus sp. YT155 TaxID=3060955 RepID=UPI00265F4288|nr:M15 family metallopeptidase [Lactobacillus sp. YT155]MDO1605006.1 M15 family metallopeptidase [Lactobacillus sp. YT155]